MRPRIFRYLKLILISLFLVTRFAAIAHTSEYGNGPHKHNGKICVLAIAADDDHNVIAILPEGASLPQFSAQNFFSRPVNIYPSFVPSVSTCMRDPPNLKSKPTEH